MAGQGGVPLGAGDQPFGDGPLCRVQPLQEDAGLLPDRVADDLLAPLEFLGDGSLDQGSLDLQELLRERDQHRDRQGAMALVRGGLEGEGHPRPQPLGGGLLHAELGRNGVGRAEPDAAHVARQPIRVLGHDLDGLMAIGLEDANRSGRADPMRVQEDHDLPHGLLLGPARHDLRRPARGRCRRPPSAAQDWPR